jgi:adenylate cyclase
LRHELSPEEELRLFFNGEHPDLERARRLFKKVPSDPRCRVCHAPFKGIGGAIFRRRGFAPWSKNPNICQSCITDLSTSTVSGTEVDITLLFADVRGSTELAAGMSPRDFSALMNRFFGVATTVLLDAEAIDKFVVSVVPVFIGDGIPLIARRHRHVPLELHSVERFEDGLVQLHYHVRKPISMTLGPARRAYLLAAIEQFSPLRNSR